MRPIQLTLAGINSFLEAQVIEFDALMQRGLFGIFGPTGSGKSTLIDAILLSLYGHNSLPRNTKDFIHTEAESGSVKLIFESGSGTDRRTYTVERQFKRSSTGVTTKNCRLSWESQEGHVVLDKTKEVDDAILSIIGLNEDQFLRTVVLPQGKFSEFIQLDPQSRRKMLEEIFKLEAYGDLLTQKIRRFKNEKDIEFTGLKGRLEQLQEVSETRINELKAVIQEAFTAIEQARAEAEKTSLRYAEGKVINDWTLQKQTVLKQLHPLEAQQPHIDAQMALLKDHESAVAFDAVYEAFTQIEKSWTGATAAFEALELEIRGLAETTQATKLVLDATRAKQAQEGPKRQDQLSLLKQALIQYTEMGELLRKKDVASQSKIAAEEQVLKLKPQHEALTVKTQETLNALNLIEATLGDMQVNTSALEGLTEAVRLEAAMSHDALRLESLKQTQGHIEEKGKALRKQVEAFEAALAETEKESVQVQQRQSDLSENRDAHLRERSAIDLKSHFADLKGTLKLGEPCPLCGQMTHETLSPEGLESEAQTAKHLLEAWEEKLQFIDAERKTLEAQATTLLQRKKRESDEKLKQERLLAETQAEWKTNNQSLQELSTAHQKQMASFEALRATLNFTSAQESLNTAKQAQQDSLTQQKKRTDYFALYQNEMTQLGVLTATLKDADLKLKAFEDDQRALNTQLEQIQRQYGLTEASASPQGAIDALEMDIAKEAEKLRLSENDFMAASERSAKVQEQLTHLKGQLGVLESQRQDQRKSMENATVQFGFDASGAHKSKVLPVSQKEALDLMTSEHERRLKELKGQLTFIENHLQSGEVSSDQLNSLEIQWKGAQEALKTLEIKVSGAQQDYDRLIALMSQKTQLETASAELEKTLGLVAVLMKLLKGGKFVEFVAMTELKYILREASIRLLEMTHHRYSLEVDSKGNFMICDHFEGGVRRDLRSLSGGETFIASLSLALSMSSRIQMKGRTTLELFLLDEGFGTLDERLLDVVMSALEKLHDERMTVGLISHVEELKNRVPVKLEVHPAISGVCGSKVTLGYN